MPSFLDTPTARRIAAQARERIDAQKVIGGSCEDCGAPLRGHDKQTAPLCMTCDWLGDHDTPSEGEN